MFHCVYVQTFVQIFEANEDKNDLAVEYLLDADKTPLGDKIKVFN